MKRVVKIAAGVVAAVAVGLGALPTERPVRAAAGPSAMQIDSAVDRGLAWLGRTQGRDGAWTAGGGEQHSAAITALAVLAFMARGHVPGQGPYGNTLNRAIDYVMNVQRPDGLLAPAGLNQSMYDHGICTVMLCEAYGMLDDTRQAQARLVISRAVELILAAQRIGKSPEAQGGWRYQPDARDSDLSVTGWQLMALRAAGNAGANVPRSALDAGIAYVRRRATAEGSFEYTGSGRVNSALTGTGVLSLVLLGQPGAPEVFRGGDYLINNPMIYSHYYYMVYYVAQAAWQLGGLPSGERYWRDIGPVVENSVIGRQRADGSWPTGPGEDAGGTPYATAMSILALSVQYRYLPIYQR